MHIQGKDRGFSLLELMIVVAIIGIITAFAVPSYTKYTCDSRKSDATTALIKMAQRQEQYFLQNDTYSTDPADLGGTSSAQGYYTLAVSSANASTFLLAATDNAGAGAACDAACVTINLNQADARTPAACWR